MLRGCDATYRYQNSVARPIGPCRLLFREIVIKQAKRCCSINRTTLAIVLCQPFDMIIMYHLASYWHVHFCTEYAD